MHQRSLVGSQRLWKLGREVLVPAPWRVHGGMGRQQAGNSDAEWPWRRLTANNSKCYSGVRKKYEVQVDFSEVR